MLYAHSAHTTLASTSPTPFMTAAKELDSLSHWDSMWRSINPQGWPTLDITVPPASIIVMSTPGHSTSPADIVQRVTAPSRLRLPRFKPLLYLFKVVILPQAFTAGSLWALLLYLLKDADLLDAQRDRLGRGEELPLDGQGGDTGDLASQSSVHMLPCGHACDIEHITVSQNGQSVVTVGLDNSIALWRLGATTGTGTREVLKLHTSVTDSTVLAVAIDAEGDHVAASLAGGMVQIWRITVDDAARSLSPIRIDDTGKIVVGISFDPTVEVIGDPFKSPSASFDLPRSQHPRLTVMYADASIIAITETSKLVTLCEAGDAGMRALPLASDDVDDTAMLIWDDHNLQIVCASAHWTTNALSSHATPGDRVTSVSPLRQTRHDLVLLAVGRASGLVEIFDAYGGEMIASIGQMQQLEPIRHVDLALPSSTQCTRCGTTSTDGFTVISSSGDQVYIDRVIPPSTTVCRCPDLRRSLDGDGTRPYPILSDTATKTRSTDSLIVPPDSARAKLSPSSSPRRSPSLLPPTSNGEFPLSSHGTRKLSAYQPPHDGMASTPVAASHDRMPTAIGSVGLSAKSSMDQTTVASWSEMEVLPLGSVLAHSGSWTVIDDVVIGLRRTTPGIGHEQWQVWTIDLRAPYNGTTLNVDTRSLATLEKETRLSLMVTLASGDSDQGTGGIAAQQRVERLHSISGRATFPSIRGSFSVPTYPGLAYIDIRTMVPKGKDGVIAAFGNQLGIITLPVGRSKPGGRVLESTGRGNLGFDLTSPVQRTPRSRLSSTSGLDKRPSALGLTPPPPRKVSEDRKAS